MLFLVVVIALGLVAVTELMFRFGRSAQARHDESSRSQLSTIQAATLGMLALILGFTMSMAESRYQARRVVKVDEAGAVRAVYLRADLLPEAERARTRKLLVEYVEARRAYYRAAPEEVPATTARAVAVGLEIWEIGVAVASAHPDWDVLAGYVDAVNKMIELEAVRDVTLGARLPSMIHALLIVVAIITIGVTGFATGVSGARSALSLYLLPVLVAFMCTVIVDLDRSRFGLITAADAPMDRVKSLMELGHSTASR